MIKIHTERRPSKKIFCVKLVMQNKAELSQ